MCQCKFKWNAYVMNALNLLIFWDGPFFSEPANHTLSLKRVNEIHKHYLFDFSHLELEFKRS